MRKRKVEGRAFVHELYRMRKKEEGKEGKGNFEVKLCTRLYGKNRKRPSQKKKKFCVMGNEITGKQQATNLAQSICQG